MKWLLLFFAILTPNAFADGDPPLDYARFKEGCAIALNAVRNGGKALDYELTELLKANEAMGYVRGAFDTAKQIQTINPDIRLLDPEWKEAGIEQQLSRVVEITDSIAAIDPTNANQTKPAEVLAIALRNRKGLPDLRKAR